MKKLKSLIVVALLLPALFIVGYRSGYKRASSRVAHKNDTVEVIRTIREPIPPPQQIHIVDFIFFPIADTIRVNDTLLVPIPREQRTYSTDRYTATISGFMPTLDYIETYQLTRTITNTIVEPRPRWGFSLGVGPSLIYSPFYKGIDAGIGIFGGVTYSF